MPFPHLESHADISLPPAQGCSIIVVQPEERRRDILVTALNLFGHQARGVVDSDELRTALAEEPAEMVLLDLLVPTGEGAVDEEAAPVWHGGIIMLTGLSAVDGRQVVSRDDVEIYVAQSADLRQLDASLRSLCPRPLGAAPTPAGDDDMPFELPDFDWVDTAPAPRAGCGGALAHRPAGAFGRRLVQSSRR